MSLFDLGFFPVFVVVVALAFVFETKFTYTVPRGCVGFSRHYGLSFASPGSFLR